MRRTISTIAYHSCSPLVDWAGFLSGTHKKDKLTSQNGEDGVLAALFAKIGTTNQWCFEVGAGDGETLSNIYVLYQDGWSAVMIEACEAQWEKLKAHATDKVHVYTEMIDAVSLERCLSDAGAPYDMDLGVLDVDCQEYWLWKGMEHYRSRVMLVEWAYWREFDDPHIPELNRDSTNDQQQTGMAPLKELGEELGYTLLATIGCNLLFVRTELMT